MSNVKRGSVVVVKYTCKSENGDVLDTTCEPVARESGTYVTGKSYLPLVVRIGSGQVIPGIEKALINMKEGEKKKVSLDPEEAYGQINKDLIYRVGRDFLKNDIPSPGKIIITSEGQATIKQVDDKGMTLDFNHPFAGRTLLFEIKVEKLKGQNL